MAMDALRAGQRVSRDAYNPTGELEDVWLVLVPATTAKVAGELAGAPDLQGLQLTYGAHIAIKTAAGTMTPWEPSQDALLAEDWYTLEDPRQEWHPYPGYLGTFYISVTPHGAPLATAEHGQATT